MGRGTFRAQPKVLPREPFWYDLGGLFAYPLRAQGIYSLLLSAVFFAAVFFILQHAWIVGIPAMIAVSGYIFAYFLRIIKTTIKGDKNPPSWPDFTETTGNFFRMLALYFVPLFVPLIAYAFFCAIVKIAPNPLITFLLVMLGLFYIPMATIVLAAYENMSAALNPVFVFASILKVPGHYLASVVVVYILTIVSAILEHFTSEVPFGSILRLVIYFYFSMVSHRLLGLMYLSCQNRLGW
jgi:hypothetical protein